MAVEEAAHRCYPLECHHTGNSLSEATMPGPQGYGPGGKWIHDRAHRIMKQTVDEYGEEKGKRIAYALATLQAHRLGKTPKKKGGYGTPQGKKKARQLYDKSPKEYKKTAGLDREVLAAFFDELFGPVGD